MLKSFHDKCVLVSGQGPVTDIANTYPSHITAHGECSSERVGKTTSNRRESVSVQVQEFHKRKVRLKMQLVWTSSLQNVIMFTTECDNVHYRMCNVLYRKCNVRYRRSNVIAQWLHILSNQWIWPLDHVISLGFRKVVSIEQLREHHPLLDMVDHNRKPILPVSVLPVTDDLRSLGQSQHLSPMSQLLM